MADRHDPMCPCAINPLLRDAWCQCALIARVVERERERREEFWEARWREAAEQREQMQVDRDAARAEVAALKDALRAARDEEALTPLVRAVGLWDAWTQEEEEEEEDGHD